MKKELQTVFSDRQYMVSKDFEIYYYNDRNIKGVRSHAHDYFEFYFFMNGSVTLYVNNSSHNLSRGDLLIIPPHVPHRLEIKDMSQSYERFIFWISMDFYKSLCAEGEAYSHLFKKAIDRKSYVCHFDELRFASIQNSIFKLIEELHGDRYASKVFSSLYVRELILSVTRQVFESENPINLSTDVKLYDNILKYIDSHIDEELSLQLLSDTFYVNKYYVAHLFKDNLGLSLHQYITKKRLELSAGAILSGTDIVKAFLLVGFKDYSAFFRAFKKEYGMSPKEFREVNGYSAGKGNGSDSSGQVF